MKQQLADFLEVFGDVNKTAVLAVLLLIATILRVKGYIEPSGFVDLCKTTTISYFGTTVASHFTSMIQDHLGNKLEAIKAQVDKETS